MAYQVETEQQRPKCRDEHDVDKVAGQAVGPRLRSHGGGRGVRYGPERRSRAVVELALLSWSANALHTGGMQP